MDTARQSTTPTTPAFPQEPPTATSSNLETSCRLAASPNGINGHCGRKRACIISGTFNNPPVTVSDSKSTSTTLETTSLHPQLALYTRRALRRHQAPYRFPYEARHHCQFVHLLCPLRPLVSIETGLPHPCFPRNLLQYHLLSHAQLDDLAEHYHQSDPNYYSLGYPTTVVGRWWAYSREEGDLMVRDQHFEALMEEARSLLNVICEGSVDGAMMNFEIKKEVAEEGGEEYREVADEKNRSTLGMIVEDKRRRFGRFIGLRDCESPGVDDAQVMERAMEAWVWGEIGRRMQWERESEVGMRKGAC